MNHTEPRTVRRSGAGGLSRVELVALLVTLTIVSAVALPGLNKFLRSVELSGTVGRIATSLRVVRQRAITEKNDFVVLLGARDHIEWWDDDDGDGVKDGTEESGASPLLPGWMAAVNDSGNPFASDTLTFHPDGSASQSGTLVFRNMDGFQRTVSVIRPTGMVTMQ